MGEADGLVGNSVGAAGQGSQAGRASKQTRGVNDLGVVKVVFMQAEPV